MNKIFFTYAFVAVLFAVSTLPVIAGPLDDYYLEQYGTSSGKTSQKALSLLTLPEEDTLPISGTPLKHGLQRDWNLLEQSTHKVLAKQIASPVLASEATFTSSGGHFRVHYATTGTDAPPLADANSNGVPDWVETVASTFENVHSSYISLGYQPAPTTPSGAPYGIYLHNLAPQGFYGLTTSDLSASTANYPNAFTSWLEIDNNFTDAIYRPGVYTPLQSLQITAAHEYHHAIQYGYNIYFDVWFAEATSVWMEDELYNGVNQGYSYILAWLRNSTKPLDLAVGSDAITSGAGYSRWLFNRFLSEKHGPAMIRSVWETAGGSASPGNGADIPMTPILNSVLSSPTYSSSLSADFFAFAKRVYTRDWTTHTSELGNIPLYSPITTYSSYPVNGTVSSISPSIALPQYSFAFYRFVPTSIMHSLTITIAKSSGIQTAVFKKCLGTITEIAANPGGNSYTDNAFSSSEEVVLLVANTANNHSGENANFSTDGTLSPTNQHIVTPTTGSGYTLSPATPQTVNTNETTSFTITPISGYGIASVTGCSGSLSGNTYTTGPIAANCTVNVTAVARNAHSIGSAQPPTIADALKVLNAIVGITPLTATEKIRYDVAPLSTNGTPLGNSVIDAADVILILRRSIGIGSW